MQIALSYPKLVQNVVSMVILIKSWKAKPLTIGRRPNNKGSSVERVTSGLF